MHPSARSSAYTLTPDKPSSEGAMQARGPALQSEHASGSKHSLISRMCSCGIAADSSLRLQATEDLLRKQSTTLDSLSLVSAVTGAGRLHVHK